MFRFGLVFLSLNVIVLVNGEAYLDVIYWEVKPIIFTNKYGELDGMIPEIVASGEKYCLRDKNRTFVNFAHKEKDRKSFYDFLHSNLTYGEKKLSNFSKEKTMWLPIDSYKKSKNVSNVIGYLTQFQIMKTSEMVVIVPLSLISLPNKIIRGIGNSHEIIIFAILLSMVFGMIIWLVERSDNDQIQKSFHAGSATSLWWSFVSMTSVGYGDVIPRSIMGRLLGALWVFFGVLISCSITSTITESVTKVDDLGVKSQKISVIEDSYEMEAVSNYDGIPVPADSYEKVLQLVRDGHVFGAMMNIDIAAWYHNEITDTNLKTPLAIIKKLPAELSIDVLLPLAKDITTDVKRMFNCMYMQRDEVYKISVNRYRKFVEVKTVHFNSFSHSFTKNITIKILLVTVCIMILIGIVFDFYTKRKRGSFRHGNADVMKMELIDEDQ